MSSGTFPPGRPVGSGLSPWVEPKSTHVRGSEGSRLGELLPSWHPKPAAPKPFGNMAFFPKNGSEAAQKDTYTHKGRFSLFPPRGKFEASDELGKLRVLASLQGQVCVPNSSSDDKRIKSVDLACPTCWTESSVQQPSLNASPKPLHQIPKSQKSNLCWLWMSEWRLEGAIFHFVIWANPVDLVHYSKVLKIIRFKFPFLFFACVAIIHHKFHR